MSLMRFRRACRCLHLRQLCTSTSTSDNTHLLLSAFNEDTFHHHFFSIPIIHDSLSLGSPTPLFTLPSHPMGLTSSRYLNPLFCFHGPNDHDPILTYNPTTQQTLTLPFDPPIPAATATTLDVKTHFGFDPITKLHKILRVKWIEPIPQSIPRVINMECMVLTLGKGSWRKINIVLPFDCTKFGNGGESLCINGAIHWLTCYGDSIVAFDLKDENFRLTPLPHDYKEETYAPIRFKYERLIEVGGRLALIGDTVYKGDYIMHMWILKDYHNHVWVKKRMLYPVSWINCGQPVPIGTISTGEILLKPLSLYKTKRLVWLLFYDMDGRGFKKVDITGLPEWVYSGGPRIIRTIAVYG
nr:F-box/LRR-repeat protein At2g40920-like [Quercus suber]POE75916.1 f-box/lrr-repeat protein [Quercus suber]